jgi:hypothetical protein
MFETKTARVVSHGTGTVTLLCLSMPHVKVLEDASKVWCANWWLRDLRLGRTLLGVDVEVVGSLLRQGEEQHTTFVGMLHLVSSWNSWNFGKSWAVGRRGDLPSSLART